MEVVIGKRYNEEKERLISMLGDDKLLVTKPKDDDGRYCCYFCVRRIPPGEALMAEEIINSGIDANYLHRGCYEKIMS
ncbi:hypothetical protein COU61_03010 [Candidatus Pacearchaeota archaeon CG10_big_fil_rev_8_21_14_0_10_35_13]|nr:MAG: hypothetical protein COU61_03010 [Candidatus Pacearchaeota archaeon CG10_big_fil_rev_8_21_14_0_10_35_13]